MTAPKPGDIFQPGDLLNNTYRIEAILGRGGTSEVYKARSEISGKVMAVKALRAEFASNEDFLVLMTREEDIRDVQHDAIVRYFDTQRMADGVVYLVMDYVDGPGLDAKLASGGMGASELMIVGERVTEGLIAAHKRNIVHRDLSPDNIILRNDDPAKAVIIDFGIAKDTNPGAETIVGNEFAGKYAYAAPEQLSGQTDSRSDIYSLGALLLSTFRGKKPDIGNNPMEVVQKKGEPLDLDGVPDPLRRLIARMTHPDPNQRFASAEDLLAAFQNPDSVELTEPPAARAEPGDALDDATVIAPLTAKASSGTIGIPKAAEKTTPPDAPARKSMLLPVLVGLALVVGLGGVGGYMMGLFDELLGPSYPVADPYTLTMQRQFESPVRVFGHVPTPETRDALEQQVEAMDGQTDLSLSSGDIATGWGEAILSVLGTAQDLDEFLIEVDGNQVTLTGLAGNRRELEAVQSAFASGFPGALQGAVTLQLGPRFLKPEMLRPLLDQHADCGPLRLASPPPLGYGLEDRVIVTGRFAEAGSREALTQQIQDMAGDRPVRVEAEILNEALCQIDAALPAAAPGRFDVRFGHGGKPGENISGRYVVGENPVIDIRLPDAVTEGYLWVSVVDVKGVVFHLLPNRIRPDNSISTLREQAEDGFVRVAYSLEEAQGTGRLAFTVDGSVLGKSKVIVLHSESQLFDELRPTTESASGYAEALQDARETGGLFVLTLDSAILTTEE